LIRQESEAVSSIPVNESYFQAIDLIYHRVHEKGGKIVSSGMGKAGEVAHWISNTFSSTGTPGVFLHPSDAQHGDLGMVQSNDLLFLISNSGKTRELLELVELTNRLYTDIPLILITGENESPLAQAAQVVLLTGKPDEVCPLGMAPTTSHTVMTVIGDVLVAMMMKKINFSVEEYAKRHHGGYLGAKSRGILGK
jgi:arabinose-5-phosphate isomerase